MPEQGDTRRPRSVKAEFDPNFAATSRGEAVLAEKAMRSLRVRRWTLLSTLARVLRSTAEQSNR